MESILCDWKMVLNAEGTPVASMADDARQRVVDLCMRHVARTLRAFSVTSNRPDLAEPFKKHLQVAETAIIPTLLGILWSPDRTLVNDALMMLFRLFSFKAEVCRKIDRIQLLFDERSEEHYKYFCERFQAISTFAQLRSDSECQQVLTDLEHLNDTLYNIAESELKGDSQTLLDGVDADGSIKLRLRTTTSARSSIHGLFAKANSMLITDQFEGRLGSSGLLQEQQGVLLNMGMHNLIARLLDVPFDPASEPSKRLVFEQAYQFLVLFCLSNGRTQHALFALSQLPRFVEHIGLNICAENCNQSGLYY
eukprot:TRINITY_DN11487_c0_g1_i1.p1 TRINITY_DN11487_c0_g1~~TRINITY_DN11487_c0_g1_i1.p1  ORF type:complete len:309 (-),score=47.25 TRINITY_DN11487_c0_g1_i1:140-1066(-)